jgi:hypothetical protein
VRADVRLVQRRRVHDGAYPGQRRTDRGPVGHRRDDVGERRWQHVDPGDVATLVAQRPHERLAEMAGAAGDQDPVRRHPATIGRRGLTRSAGEPGRGRL